MTADKHPLTDEQFADLLARPARADHAQEPAEDADLAAMRSALQSYRTETLQWAERRSAGQPSLAAAAQRQQRWAALPQWSLALVALVTIAGGVVRLTANHAETDAPAAEERAVPPAESPMAADIAADNRLLSSIDAELSYHATTPVDALRLQDDVRGPRTGVTE